MGQQLVDIGTVRLDGLKARFMVDQDAINEYAVILAKDIALMPPITVFYDGEFFWAADGSHRVLGAQRAGVPAIYGIVKPGDRYDAFLFSASCNVNHGVRRSRADKRQVVETFFRDEELKSRNLSARQIAKYADVSHSFVNAVRDEYEKADKFHGGTIPYYVMDGNEVEFTNDPPRHVESQLDKENPCHYCGHNWWLPVGDEFDCDKCGRSKETGEKRLKPKQPAQNGKPPSEKELRDAARRKTINAMKTAHHHLSTGFLRFGVTHHKPALQILLESINEL